MPGNWLPLTHVKQSQRGACLPACVRMILLALGDDASEGHLVQLFDTEWYGTPANRIQRLAQRGYRVTYEQTTLEQLQSYLHQQIPVIIYLRTGGLPGWREDVAHAVIVVGLTSEMAIIHDPARDAGPDEISLAAFLLAWSEMDYYCATIIREQLSPGGPLLIANDPYNGVRYDGARLILPEGPGLGVAHV